MRTVAPGAGGAPQSTLPAMSQQPAPEPAPRGSLGDRGSPDAGILDHRRTSAEVGAAAPGMALLPLGATEQHGAHLPCGTDTFLAGYLADEIARRLPVWRLPTLPITVSHMHRGSPGTVWITNRTLMAVVTDVVLSLRTQGVRRVVLVNGHGGTSSCAPSCRTSTGTTTTCGCCCWKPP